jgi:hypothetical protein
MPRFKRVEKAEDESEANRQLRSMFVHTVRSHSGRTEPNVLNAQIEKSQPAS